MTKSGKLLFIGDSITDAGRDREDPGSLGAGFVSIIAASLIISQPQSDWQILNRGISGDRVDTLVERWDRDALAHKPDVVTLMIGINNTIHRFKRDRTTTDQEFGDSYRELLSRTRATLPAAQIITMDQFLLPVEDEEHALPHHPVLSRLQQWREDLDPKIGIVRQIAAEFCTEHIFLDHIFTGATSRQPASFWLRDGVHPTMAGHALIAAAWIERFVVSTGVETLRTTPLPP